MIDRQARDLAAEILRQFFSGRFSQFDFEERIPESKDPAISAIDHTVWCFYDDFCEHKMTGEWKLTPEWRRIIARWVMFLHCDFEYEWPSVRYPGLRPLVRTFFRRKEKQFMESGDYDVWPFINRASYESAKSNPVLLAGEVAE